MFICTELIEKTSRADFWHARVFELARISSVMDKNSNHYHGVMT